MEEIQGEVLVQSCTNVRVHSGVSTSCNTSEPPCNHLATTFLRSSCIKKPESLGCCFTGEPRYHCTVLLEYTLGKRWVRSHRE